MQGEAGAGVPLMEDLVGDLGSGPEIPGNNGSVSRVPSGCVGAAKELGAFLKEENVQGLLDGSLVAFHHLFRGLLGAGQSRSRH